MHYQRLQRPECLKNPRKFYSPHHYSQDPLEKFRILKKWPRTKILSCSQEPPRCLFPFKTLLKCLYLYLHNEILRDSVPFKFLDLWKNVWLNKLETLCWEKYFSLFLKNIFISDHKRFIWSVAGVGNDLLKLMLELECFSRNLHVRKVLNKARASCFGNYSGKQDHFIWIINYYLVQMCPLRDLLLPDMTFATV